MSKRWEDMTGMVFGKLTAVSHVPDRAQQEKDFGTADVPVEERQLLGLTI